MRAEQCFAAEKSTVTESVIDGRYRVHGLVGAGSTANVYRAEDMRLGREVAVKILHRCLADDHALVERFQREARSAAALRDEHVVRVYDRGECEGTHYIVMEYVAGRSLKSIVEQEAPVEPGLAIDLGVQLLLAARSLHRRGIIHRDLKPGNAMVDGGGHLKVIDFGIARDGASDITRTGSILGTVRYVAPEQAQARAPTCASDLYSIGIILYELLTGRAPFDHDSAIAVVLKHINERPLPLSARSATVTPELDSAVMRALEKDPGRRHADADAFIAALEGASPSPVRCAPARPGSERRREAPWKDLLGRLHALNRLRSALPSSAR